MNPQGCEVFSFKQPSANELEHDFLWRTTCVLPERGRIGIFNRSYYEEVLVVRVHPEILRNQGLPEELREDKTIWEERYRSIVDLESHLYRNGTRIIKFFLHLSKDEQRKRFLERIDEPDHNWKFSTADIHERKYWKDYTHAYEECLNATSTHHSPWYARRFVLTSAASRSAKRDIAPPRWATNDAATPDRVPVQPICFHRLALTSRPTRNSRNIIEWAITAQIGVDSVGHYDCGGSAAFDAGSGTRNVPDDQCAGPALTRTTLCGSSRFEEKPDAPLRFVYPIL